MNRVLLATALLLPTTAWADPCTLMGDGMPTGPVDPTFHDGDLGAARRGCLRSEVGIGVGGRLTVETANFYGYIAGGLQLDGSVKLGDRFEVFAKIDAPRIDLAIASLSRMALGVGPLSGGFAFTQEVRDDLAIGTHAAVMLPTAYGGYQHTSPMGAELGINLTWQGAPILLLHTSLVGYTAFGVGAVPADPEFGMTANLGIEVRPTQVFGFVVDLDASLFYVETVDHIAPGIGLRFSDGKRFGFELGARLPVYGRERALVTLGARTSVRIGPIASR